MVGEKTRLMWCRVAIPTMLMLVMAGSTSNGALCPGRCFCNDEDLSAYCASAGLQVVPIQLNPEVRHMNLSFNKISSLYYTLIIYDNLITLDLSANKLNSLESNNFQKHASLKLLNISRNLIDTLHKDSLNGLKALTYLDLSYNRLTKLLNYSFLELHSLETLKLTGNLIDNLESGIFRTTKHLKEIFLEENQLMEIPSSALADCLPLQTLALSQNYIEDIGEGDMPNVPELASLALDGNIISIMHKSALTGLPSLRQLDISDNNFTTVPTASLAKLSNLTYIKFSGNFVRTIPPVAFRGLFRLRFLRLDRLDLLKRVDSRAFVDNINLERVWLDDNLGVDTLPTRLFHGNPRVIFISVKNNKLTTIEAAHFPLDQLKVLHLGGNPLQCNCSLLWLWNLSQEQKMRPPYNQNWSMELLPQVQVDFVDIRCRGPETVSDRLLIDLKESQINCTVNWITTVSIVTVIFLLIAVVGGLTWGHFRQRLKPTNLSSANGLHHRKSESFEPPKLDKAMVTPSVVNHIDYRSLPLWEHYSADCGHCASTMNIYEQIQTNQKSRPHIVYV